MVSGLGVVLHSHSTTTSPFPDPLSRAFVSSKADLPSITLAKLAPSLAPMAPTTPILDVGSVGVTTASAHPLPLACFDSSPERHGLNRCGHKSLDQPTLLLAIVNALAFRFEKLSVSEDGYSTLSPIATTEAPVHTATSTEHTDFITVKDSGRRKRLVQALSNRLKDHSKRVKGCLKKAFPKYGKTKKARGCIAPADCHLPSQRSFTEDEDVDVGPITQALGGLSISDSMEVTREAKFQGMFTVEIWRSLAAVNPNTTRLSSPISSSAFEVAPAGGDANTEIMDEDFPLQGTPRPTSPAATAVEYASIQSPSPEYPSSASPAVVATAPMDEDIPAQEPLRPTSSVTTFHTGRKDDRDIREPKDTDMAEEGGRLDNIEVAQQPQNDGSDMEVDSSSAAVLRSDSNESTIPPKALSPEVAIEDATGSQRVNQRDTSPGSSSALPIQPTPFSPDVDAGPTSPAVRDLVPVATSNAVAVGQENHLAQPLRASTANGAVGPESPLEGDPTRELDASVRQAAPTEQPLPAAIPTPTAEPTATPPSVPIHPLSGPSGPSTNSSNKQGPAPILHAARVHQAQAKTREAKCASKLVQSPANDEASEEAETDAFLAKYNLGRHRRLVKLLPPPPAPISKPKQSKGDASRSLMSDLMAGFTSVIKPTSSGKQAPVAAPAQRPAAPAAPSSRPAAVQSHQPLPHSDAGRQVGLPSTPPNHIGTRPEVVASRGSVIPSCRAPSGALTNGKGRESSEKHSTLSDVTMDGVENGSRATEGFRRAALSATHATTNNHQRLPSIVAGRRVGLPSNPLNQVGSRAEVVASRGSVIPSCRAPSSGPIDGMAKGPAANHSTSSDASSNAAMDGVVNGQRAVKGSRRVARATAKTGLTWQSIQQTAQDSQSAFDREHHEGSLAPIPITGAAMYQEAVKSGAWHAAQPPPPPDAIPFIRATLDDDDDDDLEKALERALS